MLRGSDRVSKKSAMSASAGDELVRKTDLEAFIGKVFLASKPIIVDSGATHHMISNCKLISNVKFHSGKVFTANGEAVPIKGVGDLELFNRSSKALFMPEFISNLLSMKKATKNLDSL